MLYFTASRISSHNQTITHTHTLTHTEALLDLSSSYPIGNTTLINAHMIFFFVVPASRKEEGRDQRRQSRGLEAVCAGSIRSKMFCVSGTRKRAISPATVR